MDLPVLTRSFPTRRSSVFFRPRRPSRFGVLFCARLSGHLPSRGAVSMYRGMTLALLVLIAGTTMASERGTRVDVEEQFAAQRTQILEELGDGETYSEIKNADREKVKSALARRSEEHTSELQSLMR